LNLNLIQDCDASSFFYTERMGSRRKFMLAITTMFVFGQAFGDDSVRHDTVTVEAEAQGDMIVVAASLYVPATPNDAWVVLTDFDHMAYFLPNIEYSQKLYGTAETFQVAQKGKAFFGPFSQSFDLIREVTLSPYREIRSRQISGTFEKLDVVTQLIPSVDGTFIVYRAELIAGVSLPNSIILAMTKKTIRDQFEAVRLEILKRKNSQRK
jgi:carbon monoxide dehydrogenase subunit G